ncbi:hypothetical protein BUALT_Bualt03G0153800 [Buddleja alternifolia]|uniref:Transmembrane protein n=1 Tax=Buddleja alternifolia TaxID=168488 RepID=A0AAV6XW85_9LAMI|nr:hypothetical protein BUALT_Bualt03G0153800 [Buddleja alternifolia]
MEALWNLEDKWNLSTQKAIALFASTSFLVIGICIAAVALKRRNSKRQGIVHEEPCKDPPPATAAVGRRSVVVEVLMGSVRWSGPRGSSSQIETPTPLLVKRDHVGWGSHNSTSAVWQRPILMGEKCELPRFSGLILYDQRGMPLHDQQCQEMTIDKLENMAGVERTTLRDLL